MKQPRDTSLAAQLERVQDAIAKAKGRLIRLEEKAAVLRSKIELAGR